MFDNLRKIGTVYGHIKHDARKVMQLQAAFAQRVDWAPESHHMAMLETIFADQWVQSGEIVYNLSHSLAALFSLTSAPEIDWEHFPHAAFIIQVPRAYLPLPGTIEPESSYLYVTKGQLLIVADYDTTAFSWVASADKPGTADFFERMTPKQAVEALQTAKMDRDGMRPELMARMKADALFKQLPQSELEQVVEAVLDFEEANLRQMQADMPGRVDAFHVGVNLLSMRFLANTLAYLNEAQPGSVTAASPDAQRRPRIMNMLPPRELIVQRTFRDAAKDAVASTVAGSVVGVKRALKHHVRGHWRNQAVGPAHSQRRRTWIHPHERGSQDFGTVVRRVETLNIPVEPRTN